MAYVNKLLIFFFMIFCFGKYGISKEYLMKNYKYDKDNLIFNFTPNLFKNNLIQEKYNLKLRGKSRFVKDKKFNICLETFGAEIFPIVRNNFFSAIKENMPEGIVIENRSELSPENDFTIEMMIKPKKEIKNYKFVFLVDKMFQCFPSFLPECFIYAGKSENKDYSLFMVNSDEKRWYIVATLGFGDKTCAYTSEEFLLEPEKWIHIAFYYDGKGTGKFFLNREFIGKTSYEKCASISPGDLDLCIGDRIKGIHYGFPAYFAWVRIHKKELDFLKGIEIKLLPRTVFERMEPNVNIKMEITNNTERQIENAKLLVLLSDKEKIIINKEKIIIPTFHPYEVKKFEIPFDSSLKPGKYRMDIIFSGLYGKNDITYKKKFEIYLMPRNIPNQFPIILWGIIDLKKGREFGFTHQLFEAVNYKKIWEEGKITEAGDKGEVEEWGKVLDKYFKNGINAIYYTRPGKWVLKDEKLKDKFQRIYKNGKAYSPTDVCGLFPEVQEFCYNVGGSIGKTFCNFPVIKGVLIHSEARDHTQPCFHKHDLETFKTFSGSDIPDEITGKWGIHYTKLQEIDDKEVIKQLGVHYLDLKNIPENRIISNDNKILVYYKWFWKEGDGWNILHTKVHEGLKKFFKSSFWTIFDPAVRCPPIYGSGGSVDVIEEWTTTVPDPIKNAQVTAELLCMAKDSGKKVIKMTQLICAKETVTSKTCERKEIWEEEYPEAIYITPPPDHLKEAIWSKLSLPINGVMFHGWNTLIPVEGRPGRYRCTNLETGDILKTMIKKVIKPLGPTLLQLYDPSPDIALLESFTSYVFAGRGTWGHGLSWEADMYLILQWAHLQPEIIYEETILKEGLDKYKILVMPYCDILPESIAKKILDFQKNGGVIIGDEFLTPVIKPNILIESYKRSGDGEKDKNVLQKKAIELKKAIESFYKTYVDSSEKDIILRVRKYKDTDYIFVLNDKRTFGDYLGHHKKILDKGLPITSEIVVRRKNIKVFDLIHNTQIKTEVLSDGVKFKINLGPGDGNIFMLCEKEPNKIRVEGPLKVKLGERINFKILIFDDENKIIENAAFPVEINIFDSMGEISEFSGFNVIKAGQLSFFLDIAKNDSIGTWKIYIRELSSNLKTIHNFLVY